jgi:hypothetical protein
MEEEDMEFILYLGCHKQKPQHFWQQEQLVNPKSLAVLDILEQVEVAEATIQYQLLAQEIEYRVVPVLAGMVVYRGLKVQL